MVNVDGQICELIKAEAKGGNYHRRVPRKSGKGYTYYYDEEKYNASKQAHLDGPATRSSRLAKAVLGAVEGAGKNGCAIKSLRDMAKKEGKEHVAKAIKGCLEKGDLTYKKGMLYRKAVKKAKLELAAESKEEQADKPEEKPEQKDAAKKDDAKEDKEQKEKGKEKPLKKSDVRLYLHDPLCKARGHKYISKKWVRDHWEYTYPEDVKKQPAKKGLEKPQAQLSLFGHQLTEEQKKAERARLDTLKAVAERKQRLAAEAAHVEEQKPKTIEPAVEPQMMTAAEMEAKAQASTAEQVRRREERAAEDKARAEWAAGERAKTPEQREAELEAHRDRWRAVPRSGKGWRLLAKPLPEVRLKKDNDDLLKKLVAAPLGSIIRMTDIDGSKTDYRKVSTNAVRMIAKGDEDVTEKMAEVSIPMDMILPPGLFANVQAELKAPPKGKEPKPDVQPVEEPPQEGESGLPEIPPKPAAPPRIPKGEFKAEMRRRYDLDLTPQGDSYSVKDEIKDVGGIWARNEKTWLLPSQEALDYIQALMAHKAVEQNEKVAQAASEGRVLSGKTWDARLAIKKAGGQWQGASKSWVLPDASNTALLQDLIDTGGASIATPQRVEEAASLVRGLSDKAWQQFNDDQWPSREVLTQELSGYNMFAVVDTILELKEAAKGNK